MSDKKSAGVCMKNLLEPQLHTILQLVEIRQAPALVLRNLFRPLFPESFPSDSVVVISNVRYKARSILAKRKSSTNEEDLGTESTVISFPSDRLQLEEFVYALESSGVTTFQSSLDEPPPPFIDISSSNTNQLLSKILNEGTKDAVLIERYLEALHQKDPGFTYKIAVLFYSIVKQYKLCSRMLVLVGRLSRVQHLHSYISYLYRNSNVMVTTNKEYSSDQYASSIIQMY
jgi:hypothetical protein